MASISIRNARLGFANIAYKSTDKDAEAVRAVPRYKRDTNNMQTDVLDGFSVDIVGIRGQEQTVKLPVSARASVEQLQKLLADKKNIIRIRFIGFVAKGYCMMQEGRAIAGISCSATDLEVTSTETAEDETDIQIDFE